MPSKDGTVTDLNGVAYSQHSSHEELDPAGGEISLEKKNPLRAVNGLIRVVHGALVHDPLLEVLIGLRAHHCPP